ncbi:MAG: group II intron reverse transcriptase/maturase [bacterium]
MKLYSKIYNYENLLSAWDRVEENHGCAGVDGVSIEKFASELGENLLLLQKALHDKIYTPHRLLRFYMEKEDGSKRPLSVPTIRDRVAQVATLIVLEPIIDAEFEQVSFAFRHGKSIYDAIDKINFYREAGYTWVVDADIDSYFDEVDHDLLLTRFSEIIKDVDVQKLIKLWLKSEIVDGNTIIKPKKGLPQGSPISPLLANLYLDKFDETLLEEDYKLVRFADDFLILCKSRPKAERALKLTSELLKEIRLRLDEAKTSITTFNHGFKFLGALFVRSVVLPPSTKKKDKEKQPIKKDMTQAKISLCTPETETIKVDKFTPCTLMGEVLASALQERGLDINQIVTTQSSKMPDETIAKYKEAKPTISPFMRTLYLQEQGAVLSKQDERFVVSKNDKVLLEIPAIKIAQIIILGNCTLTTPVMTYCLKEKIPITFLSSKGNYYGRLESTEFVNIGLQQDQFLRTLEPDFCLKLGKAIVEGKIHNQRVLLQRHNRRLNLPEVEVEINSLSKILDKVPKATTLTQVRGLEGSATACYFRVFDDLLKCDFGFEKRIKRPPTDPVNSLLSFGYTLLFYNIFSILRVHGLNPYIGYFHGIREGHPALASDIIEELRAPIIDSLIIYLINSNILKEQDFYRLKEPNTPCLLRDEARKIFIKHFEDKMHTQIIHPYTKFHVDYRRCIDLQVQELVQYIRGDKSEYRPMRVR